MYGFQHAQPSRMREVAAAISSSAAIGGWYSRSEKTLTPSKPSSSASDGELRVRAGCLVGLQSERDLEPRRSRQLVGRDRADAGPHDPHDQAFVGVGAGDQVVALEPVAGGQLPLLRGQERQHGLQRVQAEVPAVGQAQAAALRPGRCDRRPSCRTPSGPRCARRRRSGRTARCDPRSGLIAGRRLLAHRRSRRSSSRTTTPPFITKSMPRRAVTPRGRVVGHRDEVGEPARRDRPDAVVRVEPARRRGRRGADDIGCRQPAGLHVLELADDGARALEVPEGRHVAAEQHLDAGIERAPVRLAGAASPAPSDRSCIHAGTPSSSKNAPARVTTRVGTSATPRSAISRATSGVSSYPCSTQSRPSSTASAMIGAGPACAVTLRPHAWAVEIAAAISSRVSCGVVICSCSPAMPPEIMSLMRSAPALIWLRTPRANASGPSHSSVSSVSCP